MSTATRSSDLSDGGLRIGSTCTGYGGLDMAISAVLGGQLVWCADNDRHISTLLAARYPGVPNLGDLTTIAWQSVEPVDIISAGFPCQDISYSGLGAGIEKGVRSGIWKNIAEGIRILRPKLVFVENVAGIKRRGLDRVLGDLAQLGYYTVWATVRASDVGAPHRRERVFILAYRRGGKALLAAAYARCQRLSGRPGAREAAGRWPSGRPERPRAGAVPNAQLSHEDESWGQFSEAIRRWEMVTGRPVPEPSERGSRGQPRLSPRLSEWLVGVPPGWVTGLGLPYTAQHRAIGNGVVPQQATAALQLLVDLVLRSGGTSVCGARNDKHDI
jgi:DNA (cytosine-5)-methyltransferase 1